MDSEGFMETSAGAGSPIESALERTRIGPAACSQGWPWAQLARNRSGGSESEWHD